MTRYFVDDETLWRSVARLVADISERQEFMRVLLRAIDNTDADEDVQGLLKWASPPSY